MKRIIHGIFAFVPLLFAIFMILIHLAILPLWDIPSGVILVILGCLIAGEVMTLQAIYGQKKVSDGQKGIWTVLVIALNVIVLPIFWLMYIRPTNQKKRKRKKRK